MPISNLQDALHHELKDVLSAEKQLLRALPKMAKAAEDPQLRRLFEQHTQETKVQVERLEKVFELIGKTARAEKCEAMAGIVEEGSNTMEEDAEPAVMDAMLIGAAQKAEHYEIATYGTMCAWAEELGMSQALRLLQQTLDEEKQTDEKLSRFAEARKNREAARGGGSGGGGGGGGGR